MGLFPANIISPEKASVAPIQQAATNTKVIQMISTNLKGDRFWISRLIRLDQYFLILLFDLTIAVAAG